MRRVDGMGIVCHAGLLALTVLLSAGCGQQKGAGAGRGRDWDCWSGSIV